MSPENAWSVGLLVALWGGLAAFRRYRTRTQAFAERAQYRSRLPKWAGATEAVLLIILWLGASFALQDATRGLSRVQQSGLGGVVAVLPCFLVTLAPAMLLTNLISWLTPPLRRANEAAAAGLATMSYRNGSLGLIWFGLVMAVVSAVLFGIGMTEPWAR